MKKLTAFLGMLIAGLALVGCSNNNPSDPTTGNNIPSMVESVMINRDETVTFKFTSGTVVTV